MLAAAAMFCSTRFGLGTSADAAAARKGGNRATVADAPSTATYEQEAEYWKEEAAMLSKRVQMLHLEIGSLTDLQNVRGGASPSPREPRNDEGNECDANLQISALEELLARVLAERDLLKFRNANLESLVNDVSDGKDIRAMADRYYRHDAKSGIVYQLSYGKDTIIGTTQRDLNKKIKEHIDQISKLVHKSGDLAGTFAQTPFAKSIAAQCREEASERDAVKWCQDNIKVEVLRIRNLD